VLIFEDRQFIEAAFDSEDELERVVVANSEYLFGPSSLYFPKTLIRTKDGFGTIPDGFVIDLSARRWFIVEAELAKHSVWSHIAPQVAKQIIAAMNPASRQLLTDLIVERVREDTTAMEKFSDEGIEVIDIRRVLGEILETNPIIGMPIDGISSDLREWASTLRVSVKLWIVRKHVEFGHPERVMYEIPEEFRPAMDTGAEEANDIALARYDVTIADLVAAGLLREGQRLNMTWKPRNGDKQTYEATILASGELEVLGKSFASPSYAAVYPLQMAGSTRTTANGWVAWKTENGEWIAVLREQFLQQRQQHDPVA
jgi:Restriction Enzyme Adenine Methylase Associated